MKALKLAALVLTAAVVFAGGFMYGRLYGPGRAPGGSAIEEVRGYHCPMHPGYHSDKPGNCPICGMKLVPDEEEPAAPPAPGERRIAFYRDPADPAYTSAAPGLNPATGNELIPVYEGDPESFPMGTFRITPEKQQLIGVKYGEVEETSASRRFRAVGRVAYDETRIAKVQTRIDGWIDKVFVDFTGQYIDQGRPLLTIYSPEMLATQQEYLLALRSRDILQSSPIAGSPGQAETLIAAARRRLELFELSDAQIEEIGRTGKPITYVTLYSPIRGYVVERNAFPKQRIMPDTVLYTVVDLSRVWVMADVFENEAPLVRLGQEARVTLSYKPGRSFRARASYIQPDLDPMTRTLRVRFEVENPSLELKPDMFVDVAFDVPMPPRMVVPVDAVLDSGLRRTVFVDRGNGYLEPREVEIGDYLGDRVEIRKGLKPGERIAISGTFLIDSESQLRAAAAGMAGHQHGGGIGTAPAEAGPEHRQHEQPAAGGAEKQRPGAHKHD